MTDGAAARPRDRERDGRGRRARRGARSGAPEEGPIRVTVVAPVNEPRRGLRRLRGHAPRGGRAPARPDADGAARGGDRRARARRRRRAGRRGQGRARPLEPPVDEMIVSTHPEREVGLAARNVVERDPQGPRATGRSSTSSSTDGPRARANVLVIANETVLGEPLLERIRARAGAVAGELPARLAAERPARRRTRRPSAAARGALASLRARASRRTARSRTRIPYTAAMHAVHDERVDEIIVSTFPGERSGWLRRDLVGAAAQRTGVPVEHVVVSRVRGRRGHERRARPAHHGRPDRNQSSRVSAPVLGMLLFIASEMMLFGAFFTAYFFVRVVTRTPTRGRPRPSTCRSSSPA